MKNNNWYKDYFTEHYYDMFCLDEIDKKSTEKEIGFILKATMIDKGGKILDLACGHGRHAIGLAKKGYKVFGIDFNEKYLRIAKEAAIKNDIELQLTCLDMRKISFSNEFNAVIMMYTSFGYFSDRDNLKVLEQASRSLKQAGVLLLDLPNKEWVIKNLCDKENKEESGEAYALIKRFFRDGILYEDIKIKRLNQEIDKISSRVRLYDQREIEDMLKIAKLRIINIYGDYDIKNKYYSSKSPRMIILAKK